MFLPTYKITIGTDPEVFLMNGGKYISAIDRIGGTKQFPRSLGNKGYYYLEDNVAVEFNVPPSNEVNSFIKSIEWALDEVKGRLRAENFQIDIRPAVYFSKEELADPRTHIFGCQPDTDAWTNKINPKPNTEGSTLRVCGGHIHVGFKEHYEGRVFPRDIIKAMDLFLGVPSVLMDDDIHRRALYGKAGAFRHQPWGVEYRVLSNFWIKTKETMRWAFEQTHRAFAAAIEQPAEVERLRADIKHVINKNDAAVALQMVESLGLVVV